MIAPIRLWLPALLLTGCAGALRDHFEHALDDVIEAEQVTAMVGQAARKFSGYVFSRIVGLVGRPNTKQGVVKARHASASCKRGGKS